MNQQSALFEAESRELDAVFATVRRHLWRSLVIILGCMVLAALVSLLWPRSYTAEATLAYDPQLPLIKGGGGLAMTDAQRDAGIDAQLSQVTTLPVAEDVARTVDLAANPRLQQDTDKVAAGSERKLSREEALGTALLDHVKAVRVGQTPMFTIAFTAETAGQAAQIANGFAASYLKAAVQQKSALADGSARQLVARVADLRDAATAADGRLAAFRLANNLLEQPDSVAMDQEVAALRGQLADAHGQAVLAGTRSAMGAAAGGTVVGGGSGGSIDTTAVSALTQQRAATAGELAALLGRYGDKHPDVIAAREKLAEIDTQLAQAMHGNYDSAAVEARAAGARAQALAGSLKTAETQQAANIGHDARLLDLQNSALAARLAYQDGLKISADQIAQRALVQPDAQVISAATPPLRPKSRLLIGVLVGLVLGLGAAAAVGLRREVRLRTLGGVDDIVRWLDTDYFAPLSMIAGEIAGITAGDPFAVALLHPQSPFAASVRSLATAALFAARKRDTPGGRVIGVTSAVRGEGRTTASVAMGRVLTAAGMKVALIDGDPLGGWRIKSQAGAAALDNGPQIDGSGLALFAVRNGHDAAEPGDLVQKIATLRGRYDVVIVDTAPILSVVQQRDLLAGCDALVLLAQWRVTPVRTIRKAMRRITAAGGHISGVALSLVKGVSLGSAMS